MRIACPECSCRIFPPDNCEHDTIIMCQMCGESFNYSYLVELQEKANARQQIPMPANFKLTQEGTDTVITRRWITQSYTVSIIVSILLVLLFNGFFLIFILDHPPVIVLIFLILVLASINYHIIACFFNKTEIRVNGNRIAVRHYPFPYMRNTIIETSNIAQLFCIKQVSEQTTYYEVVIRMKKGKRQTLVYHLPTPDQAIYIEQQVERILGIADRRMPGEMLPL